jgi:Rrf2 family transcriptional regulator, cysteine metabolism repressor
MKLSTKCRYGVRAMVEIARHYKQGPVKRKDISKAQDLSHAYLENILIALKANKLIHTTRGANGGFVLEADPSQISLYSIVSTLEGSIAPVDCLERESVCQKTTFCVARKAWRKLYDAQLAVLHSITLQDLLDMETEAAEIMYTI